MLRKGEIDKEVYVLRRLQAGDDPGDTGLGLHYDLTVPLARYVLEHAGKLDFPFRRYQIQKAWRGERPQEGRYREFTQADIDVIGRDHLAFHHDVEVARVMAEAFTALPFLPPLRMQINNRKLIEGFYRGIGAPDVAAVMRIIDKVDKVSTDVLAKMLADDAGLTPDQVERCLALAAIRSPDRSFADQVAALGVRDPMLDEGIAELTNVVEGCARFSSHRVIVEADLRIARGLDYYTGTVFETRMSGLDQVGSICSGGRYDQLASDGRNTYPGVGISLGITRHARAASVSRVAGRVPVSAKRGAGCAAGRGQPPLVRGDCRRVAGARDRGRGVRVRGEVRPADQIRRAPGNSVRMVPDGPGEWP